MSSRKSTKQNISVRDGLIFGFVLLGQVTAILVGTALLGFVADNLLNTRPYGLGVGVLAGGIWATVTILLRVKRELVE